MTFDPLPHRQGHAAPILYAVWAETGYLKENELLNLRKVDSILEGHPVPVRRTQEITSHVYRKWPSRLADVSCVAVVVVVVVCVFMCCCVPLMCSLM